MFRAATVQGSSRLGNHSVENHLEKMLISIKAKVQIGQIDEAVDESVAYIVSQAKTPQEKTGLQKRIDQAMGGANARGNFYRFCYAFANSDVLQSFKPDNTPPLFQPTTSGGATLFAAADHRNTGPLETIFNRRAIDKVMAPEFVDISGEVKLAIKSVASLSGKLFNSDGIHIGGCLRVSEDVVVMPLHCAHAITNGAVQFLSPDLQTRRNCHVASLLESYDNIDLAVVQLREKQEAVALQFSDDTLDEEQLILLHYPVSTADSVLQVSANSCKLSTTWDGYSLITSHDSSPGSSGGVYINVHGAVVGIHIGAHGQFEAMAGAEKYAYRFLGLSSIIEADSKLYGFLDPEGRKSQKDFAGRLNATGKLAGVPLNATGGVAFKVGGISVVKNLKAAHPIEFQATVTASLGIAGHHGETRNYSIEGEIESDHPLPCEVWRETANMKLKKFAPGTTGRPGQNKMPAMTIPENVHSILRSTIDPGFRQQLVTLCDNDQIPDALKAIIDDQKHKGLPINMTPAGLPYRNGWIAMLDKFQAMGVLTPAEKHTVVAHL